MDSNQVITDDFGVQTVLVSVKDLQDFPKFIKYVVDNNIGEKQGIFKIRLIEGFRRESAELVLEKVKECLHKNSSCKKFKKSKSKSSSDEFKPQKQSFHAMSKDENFFVYRFLEPSQVEKKEFHRQFTEMTMSTDYPTCCTDTLKSGRLELLNHYWSTLRSGNAAVLYGAGLTIKPKNSADAIQIAEGFSMSHLDTCLKFMTTFISGVSWPHFYLGLMHSTFPWHIEDGALWSTLYLHVGAPKIWFCVAAEYYGAFENFMRRLGFPQAYKECPNMMGHKCFVVDPFLLIKNGIPVTMVVQCEGELVVTRPFAAHSGFNCGLNIGEAANFASPDWVPLGMIAPSCRCFSSMVKLDLTDIIKNCRPELLECYSSGNYFKAFPVRCDPFLFGMSSEPASFVGILGSSMEPVQFLSVVKKELSEDEPSECSAEPEEANPLESSSSEDNDEEEYFFTNAEIMKAPPSLLECPACPKTYIGGLGKLHRLKEHALKYHLQSNPNIEELLKRTYGSSGKKYKTKRGQNCSYCGKFIRGSSTHVKVHMKKCKLK